MAVSILSGSHLVLVPEVIRLIRAEGLDVPIVAGGIIPVDDQPLLLEAGAARIYTPKDFDLTRIMEDMVDIAVEHRG